MEAPVVNTKAKEITLCLMSPSEDQVIIYKGIMVAT